MTPTDLTTKAAELRRLHEAADLLVLVNAWDVISATTIADLPGCRAVATASYAIAASQGYADGEQIPAELMLDTIGRIASAVDLPVTADLEAGYGNPGEMVRKAIGLGVVGANLEDALKPLDESVAAMSAAIKAGQDEGVDFVLNARTDAYLTGRYDDPAHQLADAIERGRAYLDAGATCIFVPGASDEATVAALVEGIGQRKVSLMQVPGIALGSRLAELGVARLSVGPMAQGVALSALADFGASLLVGGS